MYLSIVAYSLILLAIALTLYAYIGYPLLLRVVGSFRRAPAAATPDEWPMLSITVPLYNEEAQVRGLIESLLALDYPVDRRQILIVSDASSDGTEKIVAEYEGRGIELIRMPERRGKTAAENFARPFLRGEIVINTDASIRIDPGAIRPLLAAFADPSVGVASGRDISVTGKAGDSNAGESGYVGYEMWVRKLETRVAGIVGASGCFYAIRAHLHGAPLPEALSRDFASALIAREHGYRAVSVDAATCRVPRTDSVRREYRRKVRTMTRGIETLFFKRHLLNPLRYGSFAWMLLSHKVCRWLIPWAFAAALIGLMLLAPAQPWARWMVAAAATGFLAAGLGWLLAADGKLPRWLAIPTFAVTGNLAAVHAALRAMHGDQNPTWEPTRRDVVAAS